MTQPARIVNYNDRYFRLHAWSSCAGVWYFTVTELSHPTRTEGVRRYDSVLTGDYRSSLPAALVAAEREARAVSRSVVAGTVTTKRRVAA